MFSKRPSLYILALSTLTTWLVGIVDPSPMSFYIVSAVWLTFGGYVWFRMIQNGNYYIAMLRAVMVALIVVAILLPIEVFESLMAPLNAHLAEQNSPLPAGKLGHIGCFALLLSLIHI